ncbi:hypothetical protein ACFRCI_44045 [Streptomyces sp. NPDC056638]|uniref:hypothetical protein n=2 Tax=unclassified Streptomyces TaxID=2593676 RepID=UPI0036AE788C
MLETQHTQQSATTPSVRRHPLVLSQTATAAAFPCGLPPTEANQQSRLGFLAFMQLHRHHYLQYAQTRLDEAAGQAAVTAAFDAVACQWDVYLQSPHPASGAWRQLRAQIHTRSREIDGSTPAVVRLYRSLPHDTADAAVLRWRMRMAPEAIADLMGLDPPAVTVLLLTAQRQLPATALEQLEEHTPHS